MQNKLIKSQGGEIIKGRIVKGIGGLYTITTSDGIYECSLRGIFRKDKITPTIGDSVSIEVLDESSKEGVINQIHQRKNELIRPKVSNIDQAVVVFAITEPTINLDLLDRFIILSEEQNLEITICINKIDLDTTDKYKEIQNTYQEIGYKVICTTTTNHFGIEALRTQLQNKVSVFAGPSGVGKSSIINEIHPSLALKTGELSKKISRGKHTTRHAELIEFDKNSFVVDSPGFTSLTLGHIPKNELSYYFKEFRPFLEYCKFNDCIHIREDHCAIKEQLGKTISTNRYDRYVKLLSEK